jgi:hypothetical protein
MQAIPLPVQIIKKAVSDPSVLASDEYINAQLNYDWLTKATQQVGPNCNLECPHCFGDFGPKRKGLPRKDLVGKLLEEAGESRILSVDLVDGEPIREENREILGMFCRASEKVRMGLISNGSFGFTKESAISWFQFMKENGFNFQRKNSISISFGPMYHTIPMTNYLNIANAFKEVFPGLEPGGNIGFQTSIGWASAKKELDMEWNLLSMIDKVFGNGEQENRVEVIRPSEEESSLIKYYPEGQSPIKIARFLLGPEGRALSHKRFRNMKSVQAEPEDLDFLPDARIPIYLFSNGEVSFNGIVRCATREKYYGNIADESLVIIKRRIENDPIYQASKLGGAKFLYKMYLEEGGEKLYGLRDLIKCATCQGLFRSEKNLDIIRKAIDKKGGVVTAFKEYATVQK